MHGERIFLRSGHVCVERRIGLFAVPGRFGVLCPRDVKVRRHTAAHAERDARRRDGIDIHGHNGSHRETPAHAAAETAGAQSIEAEEPDTGGDKPKRVGWWQRRSFF